MRQTPNFAGCHAIILHQGDYSTEKLMRQMKLLGFTTELSWTPLSESVNPSLVLVDADQGWDELLPWKTAQDAPCPIVAILGSEAPSRIEWAMKIGAGAILAKPITTSAIFPALVMATAVDAERRRVNERISLLEERVRMRPLVHHAVTALMTARKLTEEDAYGLLRSFAMRRRETLEAVAASYLAGNETMSVVV
jgi:AmiR/NasT family two-component response regulator